MRILIRLLIWLSLASGVLWTSLPAAVAQSRVQHDYRLQDLEVRFDQLIQLEEWQDDRRSELEAQVREARQESQALSSANAVLRNQIASQQAVLNQLRNEQENLRQTLQAMESAGRSAAPAQRDSNTSASYRISRLRIVAPAANPPPTRQVSSYYRAHLARPGERPPNGYSWP